MVVCIVSGVSWYLTGGQRGSGAALGPAEQRFWDRGVALEAHKLRHGSCGRLPLLLGL